MKRFRQILFRATLALLLALIVLCIVGAFLGAASAKTLFNSIPLTVFWGVLAVLLAMSLFAGGKMWRSPGLIAVHLGLLLILAGGLWGSHAAHEWRNSLVSPEQRKPSEGLLLLNPFDKTDNSSSQLWRPSMDHLLEEAGQLPFPVQANRAWVEYYPPSQEKWSLLGLAYDKHGNQKLTPLLGDTGQPGLFPAIHGEVTVLGYNHELRQVELQLTHNGETITNIITAGPEDEPTLLSLAGVFSTPQAWKEAGQPSIALLPPHQDVRDYKAELVILDSDGNTGTTGVIEVNHPLHANGYHFYLSAYDPPMALLIKAVSDDGLYWVYAGFGLLMLGVVLCLWIEPIIHIARRFLTKSFPAASHCVPSVNSAVGRGFVKNHRADENSEEAGHVG